MVTLAAVLKGQITIIGITLTFGTTQACNLLKAFSSENNFMNGKKIVSDDALEAKEDFCAIHPYTNIR